VSISSCAGSGKTTTLLKLAKKHTNKKILYLAFNKSLMTEIASKIKDQKIDNMYPRTFDSLMREVYMNHTGGEAPRYVNLNPKTITNYIDFFKGKNFALRKRYAKFFEEFCKQDVELDYFIKKHKLSERLFKSLWQKAITNEFSTFESVKKTVMMNHWCKNFIDKKYDLVFIDESQDFDPLMLDMLLKDVTVGRLFVGDSMQNIYVWRGCVNAFALLPANTLHVEFYSTFRIGNPLCRNITTKFDKCHMVSKASWDTIQRNEIGNIGGQQYTYLFRTWKSLLRTAETTPRIWIYSIDKKFEEIERLFTKIQAGYYEEDDETEDQDLPAFLKSLSSYELNQLISNIKGNLVEKDQAAVLFYSTHSYKGLEDDIVRLYNDFKTDSEEELNVLYVGMSRAKKVLVLDESPEVEIIDDEIMDVLRKFKR
jgi:ATP-dependent exoDNAse (exonuclease V) beta subunit